VDPNGKARWGREPQREPAQRRARLHVCGVRVQVRGGSRGDCEACRGRTEAGGDLHPLGGRGAALGDSDLQLLVGDVPERRDARDPAGVRDVGYVAADRERSGGRDRFLGWWS